ncbi:carbohydrate ABC transporter permease [Lentzea rhizosphaerae]|uniref:Carbohydrate ABC transporter permease n=1 Tax=Lentzea rhizosphaerae TaxID=2041025 RepID=A0ABV8C161_9PSEU
MTTLLTREVRRERAEQVRKRPPFRHRLSKLDSKVSPYLFVAPFFVLFGAIGLFPLLYTAYVSLFDWDLGADDPAFVGLENYRTLFADGQFWNALFNTFSIFLLSSVPQVIVAVVLAALLAANLRARTMWRMGVLLPYVASLVALTIIFGNLFGPQFGLVNSVLSVVGIPPIDWQADTFGSHVAIASMVNWRWTGYNALIVLAAMLAIPRDLYEAAVVDGAGPVRQFFSITLPMLKPTLIFVIVTSTIGGLQIFTEPKLFDPAGGSGGGAVHQYQTVVLYLYQSAFQQFDLGYAASIAWTLFLIVIAVAGLNFWLTRRAVR